MSTALRMLEACVLVAMGSFMAVLSQSSMYWQFLNPRYSWLTLITGVVLVVIGFASLFNTGRKPQVSEIFGIFIFLVVAGTALETSTTMFEVEAAPSNRLSLNMPPVMDPSINDEPFEFNSLSEAPSQMQSLTRGYTESPNGDILLDGTPFVRINVAELYQGEVDGTVKPGQNFAIQGAVVRTKELDEAGYIGVGRLLITCCFADSTGVIALVKVKDPNIFPAGTWVRALGRVVDGVPFPGSTLTVKGALSVVRSEGFSLEAVQLAQSKVEGVPFIFEMRKEPPYAY